MPRHRINIRSSLLERIFPGFLGGAPLGEKSYHDLREYVSYLLTDSSGCPRRYPRRRKSSNRSNLIRLIHVSLVFPFGSKFLAEESKNGNNGYLDRLGTGTQGKKSSSRHSRFHDSTERVRVVPTESTTISKEALFTLVFVIHTRNSARERRSVYNT